MVGEVLEREIIMQEKENGATMLEPKVAAREKRVFVTDEGYVGT